MRLTQGVGKYGDGSACWMAAVGYYVGQNGEVRWTDDIDCVDPVIAHLCIDLNDALESDEERERVIGPHLFAPVGTRQSAELSLERLNRAINWLSECVCNGLAVRALRRAQETLIEGSVYRSAVQAGRCARLLYELQGISVLPLILELCAMGDRVEVVPARSKEEVLEFLR